jgi:hypothetical protein
MKWTTTAVKQGKTVKEVHYAESGVEHKPACRTERCKRRNIRKGK